MRIRSIRPEFWTSEDVAAMTWETRLVYIGLWSYVDDNGVGRDLEPLIVSALFPLDEDLPESSRRVTEALRHLSDQGQITRYRVDGKPYLHVTAWRTHQRIEKPSKSRYPAPTCDDAQIVEPSPTTPGVLPEPSTPGEGEKGRRGEGEKASRKRATQLPASWEPTPEHADRAKASGVDLGTEVVKFRAHADERARTAVSWNAAFTRWLVNSAEYAARDGRGPARPGTTAPKASAWGRGVPTDPYGLNEGTAA